MSETSQVPQLKFADQHVDPILKGNKTATIRVGLRRDINIGSRVQFCRPDGSRFASAIVYDLGRSIVADAARFDIDGHRSYRDVDALVAELRDYYPDVAVSPETDVTIVYWKYEELWE